jgi:hypothetical protein
MAFKGGVVLGTVSFNATGAAATGIGNTSYTGTISIGNGSATAVTILGPTNINATGSNNTAMGSTSNTGTVAIGNTNSTSVSISGPTNINTTAANNTAINSTSSTGTVTIGNTSSGVVTINSGTAGILVGTTANAHASTFGSTTAGSTTIIQAPTAGVTLTGVQGVVVANRNYVTINTATGAIGSDAAPLTSISITGDTGGALTGSAFTFSGGTTGLSFGGSGSTETLTFAGITANGGTVSLATDATTSTVNVGTGAGAKTVTLGSTNGASSLALKTGTADFSLASATGTIISALDTGEITYPLQSSFFANVGTTITDVTGDGTLYTIVFDTEVYDQNADYNNSTGIFTAPVTGRYNFSSTVGVSGLLVGHTRELLLFNASNRAVRFIDMAPFTISTGTTLILTGSTYIDMDAADTIAIVVFISGSTKTVDILGTTGGNTQASFSGQLLA